MNYFIPKIAKRSFFAWLAVALVTCFSLAMPLFHFIITSLSVSNSIKRMIIVTVMQMGSISALFNLPVFWIMNGLSSAFPDSYNDPTTALFITTATTAFVLQLAAYYALIYCALYLFSRATQCPGKQ